MAKMTESWRQGIRELCFREIMQCMASSYFRDFVQIRVVKFVEKSSISCLLSSFSLWNYIHISLHFLQISVPKDNGFPGCAVLPEKS